MADQFWHYVDVVTRSAGYLDRNQWLIVSLAVVIISFLSMRGFSSRNN
jgi:hypothetical protein